MENQSLSRYLESIKDSGVSSSYTARVIVSVIAAELRKQGEDAFTYEEEALWEAAAKLVEDME